jgi:hypothetical protein
MHRLDMTSVMPREIRLWDTLREWSTLATAVSFPDSTEKTATLQRIDVASMVAECNALIPLLRTISSPLVFAHNDILSGK